MAKHGRLFSLSLGLVLATATGVSSAETTDAKKSNLEPYPLDRCPVSGEKLGSMGKPLVFQHEGQEVRLCCKGCRPKFNQDTQKYLTKINHEIVKQQLAHYPLSTCVVSGEPLGGEDMEPIDWVYNNRLVRLCCKMCIKKFEKDPEKALRKLDQAVVARQGESYPLNKCPVSGRTLGAMGKPADAVVANRLVRLCCRDCEKTLKADPVRFLSMIDAAAKHGNQQKPERGDDHKDHGHHNH